MDGFPADDCRGVVQALSQDRMAISSAALRLFRCRVAMQVGEKERTLSPEEVGAMVQTFQPYKPHTLDLRALDNVGTSVASVRGAALAAPM